MPIDFPPRTPNVPDTNPITLGSKRYLWTGEQWAAYNPALTTQNTSTVNLTYTNGVLRGEANVWTNDFSDKTFIGNYTASINGATVSTGNQPAGTYLIDYVEGYVDTSGSNASDQNTAITVRYAIQGPNGLNETESFISDTFRSSAFYHARNEPIVFWFTDSPYNDNSGPGVTWALYRIN